MSRRALQELLANGALERVAADIETARQELDTARRHAQTAQAIADADPTAAFAVGYDAMRKAISAHMRAGGYRVARRQGHHHWTGRYASAAIGGAGVRAHIEAFDDLRQLRNQSEYEALLVEPRDVAELLDHANGLITAIARDLGVD